MQNIFIDVLPPWVETGLQPAFYDLESGTVLQQTARMYAKVRELTEGFNTFTTHVTNEVERFETEVNITVEEYIEKFNQLHDYVHDYFDNLDVQEEINNKLDEMAEDGQLADIISQYLNSTAVFGYDTVADMKSATNLVNGSFARTLGYTSKNDGGSGLYKIRYITNDDVVDEGSIISITADPDDHLIAELIVEDNTIDVKQFGAIGDGITDDTESIQKALTFAQGKKVIINNGIYMIEDTLSASGNEISGNAIIKAINNFDGNQMLMPHNKVYIDGIKFDCSNNAICAIGNSDDCTKLILNNCEFTGAKRYVGDNNFALNSCVYLTGKDNIMTNCNVHDNLSHGCRIYSKVAHSIVNIENCSFDSNGSTTEGSQTVAVGLVQYGGDNGTLYDKVTISNCHASGNANSGIAPHSCNNVVVDSCVSNDNGEHGYVLMDGKNGVISNCIADNNYRYGIRIQGDYQTTGQTYHGYKNCSVSGCMSTGSGFDIDEDIDTIKISDNILTYKDTGFTESIKGIRLGRSNNPDSYVKNANIVNNYFYGFLIYPVQSFITLDSSNSFDNFVDGVRTPLYRHASNIFKEDSASTLEYGTTDNVLAYPTDFSHWSTVSGSTIVNNVITRGTNDFVAKYVQDISTVPRFISLLSSFDNYTEGVNFDVGLRFRDSGGTLVGGEYSNPMRAKGKFQARIFDLSKITDIADFSRIAKIEVVLHLSGGSIKMNYVYCALSDKLPILPNKI